MLHKGVFLGLITTDIVYYLPSHLGRNQKMKAERQLAFAGGPATNAAVTFAAFNNQACLISGLGSHPLAHIAKQDIADHQVQLIDISDQPKRPPVVASIMVNLSDGSRSVVYSNTDVRKLRHDALSESLMEDAGILLVDGFYLPQAVQLAEIAKTRNIPTVLDGGSWKDGMEELLPLIDFAVCSSDFIPPECTDPDSIIARLASFGVTNIAITRGEKPVIASFQGQRVEVPVMQIKPIDTLGAGDIFHGAFCHYILEQDFPTSLARAAEVASMSCTSLGTRAWIEQEKFI